VYVRAAKYPETARQLPPPAYHPHTCRLIVKHLPKAILLALLVGVPVMAVDYVKCEAIQRANDRLEDEFTKALGALAQYAFYNRNEVRDQQGLPRVSDSKKTPVKELLDKNFDIANNKWYLVRKDLKAAKCP